MLRCAVAEAVHPMHIKSSTVLFIFLFVMKSMFYISGNPFESECHTCQGQESAPDHERVHDDIPEPGAVGQKLEVQAMQSPV